MNTKNIALNKKLILLAFLFLASCNNTKQTASRYNNQELKFVQSQTRSELTPTAKTPIPSNTISFLHPIQKSANSSTLYDSIKNRPTYSASNDLVTKSAENSLKTNLIVSNSISGQSKEEPETGTANKNSNFLFLSLSGLFAALVISIFIPFIPKSKRLAFWALENRKAARGIIFLGQTITGLAGLFLGKELFNHGIISTETSTYALAGITSATALLYPYRKVKKGLFKHTYAKQKIFDLLMCISMFTLFMNVGNRAASDANFSKPASTIIHALDNKENTAFVPNNSSSYHTDNAKGYYYNNEHYSKNATVGQGIASFFIILFLILFLTLIAILACILACNGQGIAALFLFFGGWALLIWAGISAVRSVNEN